ncbi:hypothetical protein LEP1GSC116_0863 [Leptospira interrogans serovar Icterohaemorrhagiae str. Verdun HP]|nr:hypothetical protein LEP1GSC037_4591 [Leptospira interrogans str. 2006001854]EMO07038.1 hypothetical protein LEP1GSC116_0863 [Leptospira interrogans serovar Icterohaemorrhagiae str. Verdun HP]
MKHGADYDSSVILLERKENGPSLEGMIADLSDEIAYTNHDIEDGWEMGYLHLGDLLENPFWKEVYEECKDQYKEVGEKILIRTSIRTLTNFLVSDLIQNIAHRLEKNKSSPPRIWRFFGNKILELLLFQKKWILNLEN